MENNLKYYRQTKGLTQEALADLANTSKSQIHKLENHHRKLTVEWTVRLAPHLDVHPLQLVLPREDEKLLEDITYAALQLIEDGLLDTNRAAQLISKLYARLSFKDTTRGIEKISNLMKTIVAVSNDTDN